MSCQNCNQTVLPTTTISGPPGTDGAPGTNGIFGGACVEYQFSGSTSGSDPGPGMISFDSSLLSLAQHLYINHLDLNDVDLSSFIASLDLPSNPVKAIIRVTRSNDASLFDIFEITSVTDLGAYSDIEVVYLSGGTNPFVPNDNILFCPALSGDAAFQLATISPDFVTGINYPASILGDVYRVLTPGWIGTTTAQEPPNSIRVFKDDILYCIANTAGGNQGAAGAAFFVFSAPRGLVPEDTTNGTSNYILNADALTTNTVSGTSSGNVILGTINNIANSSGTLILGVSNSITTNSAVNALFGVGHTLSDSDTNLAVGHTHSLTTAVDNLVSGLSHNLNNVNYNVVGGTNNIIRTTSQSNGVFGFGHDLDDSDRNGIFGYVHAVNGNNNGIFGQSHDITGSTNLVGGDHNNVVANTAAATLNAIVAGVGADARLGNSLNLGANDAYTTYTQGAFQTIIVPIAGAISNVTNPLSDTLQLKAAVSGGLDTRLLVPDDTIWYFEADFTVVQRAVGVRFTNTSTIGDNISYKLMGAARRNDSLGASSIVYIKWLDHRGNWVSATSPDIQVYNSLYTFDVAASRNDLNLNYVRVDISSNILRFLVNFPGNSTVMPDTGLATPLKGEELAESDVTITDTQVSAIGVASIGGSTFRNPRVDIYGGDGLQGGNGHGATATATLTATDIASISVCSGGEYAGTPTVVITPALGGAAATAVMAGTAVASITVTNPGAGYTTPPAISFSGGGEVTAATASAVLTPSSIASVAVTNGGIGYGTGAISKPRVVIYDAGLTECSQGNGGSFIAGGTLKISQVKF